MLIFPLAIMMIADESAREFMKALYIKYHMNMYRMAQSLCSSTQDAEDIVSDAILTLVCKISDIRTLDCNVLESYIISVVKNIAYMHLRKKHRRGEVGLDDDITATYNADSAPPDESILWECSIQELRAGISALKEDDQIIIRMKYFEKKRDREIADAFGINEVAVRVRLTRVRQKLREILSEDNNNG